jgi:hypothetical protein
MFATNFGIANDHLTHERGQENLSVFTMTKTIGSGKWMSNHFCKTCGTLMYRTSEKYSGLSILRLGTVDDFTLMETKLKPQLEQYVEHRVSWLSGVDGARKAEGMGF